MKGNDEENCRGCQNTYMWTADEEHLILLKLLILFIMKCKRCTLLGSNIKKGSLLSKTSLLISSITVESFSFTVYIIGYFSLFIGYQVTTCRTRSIVATFQGNGTGFLMLEC